MCMKAMENNRLIVLAPFQEKLSSEVLTPQLFDVRVYKTAEEAWTIFEQNKVSLFISNQAFIQSAPGGFLKAITATQLNLVHLHKYTDFVIEDIEAVVNNSASVFITNETQFEARLQQSIETAMSIYLNLAEDEKLREELIEQNQQYEFMLRQSLLS